MRRLQARSEATSPQATQWVDDHAKFLKGHPKMRSSVAKAEEHPFLMKELMAGGPNQGKLGSPGKPGEQGPQPQQHQDAPLIAPAPSQQQQQQVQAGAATRPHKSQQSLSEIIRGIIHAPEQQGQQQALSSMTQHEQWLQEPLHQQQAQQGQPSSADATRLRGQEVFD